MKKFRITVEGKTYEVEVEEIIAQEGVSTYTSSSQSYVAPMITPVATPKVQAPINTTKPQTDQPSKPASAGLGNAGGTEVKAPVTGTILRVEVNVGDKVQSGQRLIVLEAMKMETEIQSPATGVVKNITVSNGANVNTGQTLIVIEASGV